MSSNALSPDAEPQTGDVSAPPRHSRKLYGRRLAFKLRPRQAQLLKELLPSLAFDLPEGQIDPRDLFNTNTDTQIHLEIGFGGGEHLVAKAEAAPQTLFIGCEPFVNGMGKILSQIDARSLSNIRLFAGDARALIEHFEPKCLDGVYLLFPDPWPKKRHHKRRYVQPETLADLARVIAPGGQLRIASDIPDYIRWTLEHMARCPQFSWTAQTPDNWRKRPADWPSTRYEQKALKAGRKPSYLTFLRV